MNDFIASIMLMGAMASSEGYLPYWMTTNQYGLMPERNGGLVVPLTHRRLWVYDAYGDFTTSDNRYVKDALMPTKDNCIRTLSVLRSA